MDYLAIDFTTFPLRALRARLTNEVLSIADFSQGPSSLAAEADWLSRWIKTKRGFLNPTHLLAIWDSPDLSIRTSPIQMAPAAAAETSKDPTDTANQQKQETPAAEELHLHCRLPSYQTAGQPTALPLHLSARLPRHPIDVLFTRLCQLHGSCRKISILPMSLWSAYLASYPQYAEQTTALIWGARQTLTILVVSRGYLVFCRHFPHSLNTEPSEALPRTDGAQVKEALEQFSFLFPYTTLDHLLVGGLIKDTDYLTAWLEGVSDCPCELIAPLGSNRIVLSSGENPQNDSHSLSAYWPCMGIIWELHYPWKSCYTPSPANKEEPHHAAA